MNLTFNQAIVFLPLATAIITFILTSLFTMYKDKRTNNFTKRMFFEYAEFELKYPFDETNLRHGEGKVLLGENGKKLHRHTQLHGKSVFTFFVLKNVTSNDAINVHIKFSFSDRGGKKGAIPKQLITEYFSLPVWRNTDTLYIPVTIYNNSSSNFSTNEELVISYNTTTFEKFKYLYVRQADGTYKEQLKKRYFGFLWITKLNYERADFFTFANVRKADKKLEQ
ncbi:hypothetical protein LC048_14815 [Mesobacillus subterraneus]|uniref:hypothetical protein n=1 Tax=Mesobacillus subterraneus TaxID=285983 RepID=UPI001CFE6028|nr:hypothetical protein [Mesobacillus subterraneus]WLR53784.1 hypothetical protein LC048_14815 [Mesobacillus subterraneus]